MSNQQGQPPPWSPQSGQPPNWNPQNQGWGSPQQPPQQPYQPPPQYYQHPPQQQPHWHPNTHYPPPQQSWWTGKHVTGIILSTGSVFAGVFCFIFGFALILPWCLLPVVFLSFVAGIAMLF
ncbi:MAG TPA: hypothetical protein VFN02_08320 [Ktedonobacteraceae bacterium]|nr:hypothetical protein [Ktedonobacteraceae bacterium]